MNPNRQKLYGILIHIDNKPMGVTNISVRETLFRYPLVGSSVPRTARLLGKRAHALAGLLRAFCLLADPLHHSWSSKLA